MEKTCEAGQRKRGPESCSVFWAQLTCPFLQVDLRGVNRKNYSGIKNLLRVFNVLSIVLGAGDSERGLRWTSPLLLCASLNVDPRKSPCMQKSGRRTFYAKETAMAKAYHGHKTGISLQAEEGQGARAEDAGEGGEIREVGRISSRGICGPQARSRNVSLSSKGCCWRVLSTGLMRSFSCLKAFLSRLLSSHPALAHNVHPQQPPDRHAWSRIMR